MEWLDRIEAEWRDAVTRWRDVSAQFQAALELHWANRAKAESLGAEEFARWQRQLDYALQVKTAIEMLQDALAATSEWARSTFGLAGLKRIGNAANGAGLGGIPLIPVAVIVGSISTVTAAVYALNTYNAELERKWAYINANPDLTPEQVAEVLESDAPIPGLGSIKGIAVWIVIGGALLLFGPELVKRMKR